MSKKRYPISLFMMGVFLNLFSNYLLLLLLIISLIVKILIPSIPILIPLVITAIWIAWAIIKQFRYMKLILESDEPLFDRMFADNLLITARGSKMHFILLKKQLEIKLIQIQLI